MKIADIPNTAIVDAINALAKAPRVYVDRMGVHTFYPYMVSIWDINAIIRVPENMLRAKLRKLIKQGVIDGCVCGCRGDFTVC